MQYRALVGEEQNIEEIIGAAPEDKETKKSPGTIVRLKDGKLWTMPLPNQFMKWGNKQKPQIWITDSPTAVNTNQVPDDKRGKIGAGGCVVLWTDCPSADHSMSWIIVAKATSTKCTSAISIVRFDYNGDGLAPKQTDEEHHEGKPIRGQR